MRRNKSKYLYLIGIVILILIIFLPGPNGVINLLKRYYNKRRLEKEFFKLRLELELKEFKTRLLQTPSVLESLAVQKLGMGKIPDESLPSEE